MLLQISVRKRALQKLIEIYRDYCKKCSEGSMKISDHFEEIPCKIIMLCYDNDSKEFRSAFALQLASWIKIRVLLSEVNVFFLRISGCRMWNLFLLMIYFLSIFLSKKGQSIGYTCFLFSVLFTKGHWIVFWLKKEGTHASMLVCYCEHVESPKSFTSHSFFQVAK